MFTGGFVPNSTNTSLWASNWVPARRVGYNASKRVFSDIFTVTTNVPPFSVGAAAYVWGFQGSEKQGEWVLYRRSTWTWPAPAAAGSPTTLLWSSGATNVLPVVGTVNFPTNLGFHIRTVAISNSLPPPTSWSRWSTENLGAVPPAGVSGDANSNGVTDALEFALFLEPGEKPNPGSWLQIGQTNGNRHLEVRIPRRRDRPATFLVEVSTNLMQWTNGTNFTEVVEDSPQALVVRDKTPISEGGDRRFLRVQTIVTP